MNKKRYDTKHTLIVKNKIVIEEITFKNKKIKNIHRPGVPVIIKSIRVTSSKSEEK